MSRAQRAISWFGRAPDWAQSLVVGSLIVLMVVATVVAILKYADASDWEKQYWQERRAKEKAQADFAAFKVQHSAGWVKAAQLAKVQNEAARWKGMTAAKDTAYDALLSAMQEMVKGNVPRALSGKSKSDGDSAPGGRKTSEQSEDDDEDDEDDEDENE